MKPKTYSFNKKNRKPYIYKMVDVSIDHVSKNDLKLLDKTQGDPEAPIIVYPYAEGYFIHVAHEDGNLKKGIEPYMDKTLKSYGFSDEFIHIYTRAAELESYFIRLDADGIGYDDLPLFYDGTGFNLP